jgi:uncharacterized FlaG/YvyC family protein
MSFDGIPRPSSLNPYSDPLGAYAAANAARAEREGKPLVQSLDKEEKIKGLQREQRDQGQADHEDDDGEAFSEEEAEQIRIFAKMRGMMNLALDSAKRYEFRVNELTGLVDLIEMETGRLVLQLTPEELMDLSQKIERYAGVLTDHNG